MIKMQPDMSEAMQESTFLSRLKHQFHQPPIHGPITEIRQARVTGNCQTKMA